MVQQAARQQYYIGVGKRKTAIARVKLFPNSGAQAQVSINGKELEAAFGWEPWRNLIYQPLRITNSQGKFNVVATVEGGGVSAQAQALAAGVANALVEYDATLNSALRKAGFITRDARVKESKKYGLKRARRAPQYTKR